MNNSTMDEQPGDKGASADADRATREPSLRLGHTASVPSAERIAAHEKLLSREDIEAIDDLDSLIALQDVVTADAKAIEVDLEYRTDDGADEVWEHRARRALAAHYTCNGHLTRRIGFLRRGGKAPKQHDTEAKARRKEAQAQLEATQAETKRLRAVEDRNKTLRTMVQFAARQSLLAHFHAAAKAHLSRETMNLLMGQAHAALNASLETDLPAQAIEAGTGETGAGSTEGESAVGNADAPKGGIGD